MNWPRVKIALFALAIFFIAIQLVQTKETNPPVIVSRTISSHLKVPEDVTAILLRACGDCHSNRTVWPWYGHVAPISWVVVDDVNQGRRTLNFDDWDALDRSKSITYALSDICKDVEQKGMPPFSYRLVHRQSAMNREEINAICSWSNSFGSNSGNESGSLP